MYTPSEQFVEMTKSQLTPPLTTINGLAQKAFAQIEKITALNIATSKISLQESSNVLRKLLNVTDPQELLSLTIAQFGSNIERMRCYSQNLLELAEKTVIEPIQNAQAALHSNMEAVSAESPPSATVEISGAAVPVTDEPIESQEIIESAAEEPAVQAQPDVSEKEQKPAAHTKVEATFEPVKKPQEHLAKPVPETVPAPIKTAAAHTHPEETRHTPKITHSVKNKAGNKRK